MPFLLEPGTVDHLDANANMLDHSNHWDDLPPYPRIIYYFGDFNCHQIEDRSFHLHGNQLPMCARCISIFTGLSAGMLVTLVASTRMFASQILLSLIPKPIRKLIMKGDSRINKHMDFQLSPVLVLLSILLALPMALDGSIQMISSYESTNITRLATGFLFGLITGLWFSAAIHAFLYIPPIPEHLRIDETE